MARTVGGVFGLSVLFIFNHLRNPSAVQKGLQEKLTCPNKHLSLRKGKLGVVSSKTRSVSKQYKYKSIIFQSIGASHRSSTNASILKMIWSRDEATLIIYLEVMHSGTHDSSSFCWGVALDHIHVDPLLLCVEGCCDDQWPCPYHPISGLWTVLVNVRVTTWLWGAFSENSSSSPVISCLWPEPVHHDSLIPKIESL